MANIAALLKRIESGTLSYEEKLSALSQVEQSLQDMRQKKQEAIQSNVMLIVDALKQMQVKVEQQLEEAKAIVPQKGPKGDRGEKGDRGLDGAPGKDGRNGIDGKDGKDGNDGISVTDAKIDFDGSLVITLSNGREINVGEVLPLDVSDKIKVIANGGGTSQTVVDTLTSLQNQINTLTGIDGVLGDMAQQNANNVAITGGAINGATIGGVTPADGTFTTLTATGQTSLGGVAGSESIRAVVPGTTGNYWQFAGSSTNMRVDYAGTSTNIGSYFVAKGAGFHSFTTAGSITNEQFRVSHTASAVNYVQVTGAATGGYPTILGTGSDATVGLQLAGKGGTIDFRNNGIGTAIQFSVAFTSSSVNYLTATGSGASGNAPRLYAVGSDTNISAVFQSKGTGAIDLAAGSSGVNISNGGTVTAITRTAAGSGYTSLPTIAISAPTTAGGVQATASPLMGLAAGPIIVSGGTGYTVNDVLTISGSTGTAGQLTVSSVSAGVITGVTVSLSGNMSAIPTNPASVTGGTGSGATFTLTYSLSSSAATITNAGSGYVEQPTVSFSGGGGSGAAAYATVGSGTIVKSIGSTLSFYTPAGEGFRVDNTGFSTLTDFVYARGGASVSGAYLGVNGSTANSSLYTSSKGSGSVQFFTNNWTNEQLRVSHTASAVNYVQVTGAATTVAPVISAQGSDTNVGLTFNTKGTGVITLQTNGTTRGVFGSGGSVTLGYSGGNFAFSASGVASQVNYIQAAGAVTTSAPVLSAQGTDTNIDLALTPKGTGVLAFGTYTAGIVAQTGYITIKDSGGTTRRLLVG